MVLLIGSTLAAILVSGVCSIAEASLLSSNPIRLESLRQQGYRYAATLLRMKEEVDRPIAAILILNTIANTGGAVVAGSAFAEVFGYEWLWLFTLGMALAILYFSEIIPKIVGVVHHERLARPTAAFLNIAIKVLWPMIMLTDVVARTIRRSGESGPAHVSATDVRTTVRMARVSNIIGNEQAAIMLNAVKLTDTMVGEVMIPRERITFFARQAQLDEYLRIAQHALHTRYPVSETTSVDTIIGYVNLKELLLLSKQRRTTPGVFVRPLRSVRPDMALTKLLQHMTVERLHMVLVKDSDSHVVGLVTLEDVLEEIVGEIEDEFDSGPAAMIQMSPEVWLVSGSVTMGALARRCLLSVDKASADDLLTDWLREMLGAPLRSGQQYEAMQARFTIHQVRRGQVHYARVERLKVTVDDSTDDLLQELLESQNGHVSNGRETIPHVDGQKRSA